MSKDRHTDAAAPMASCVTSQQCVANCLHVFPPLSLSFHLDDLHYPPLDYSPPRYIWVSTCLLPSTACYMYTNEVPLLLQEDLPSATPLIAAAHAFLNKKGTYSVTDTEPSHRHG